MKPATPIACTALFVALGGGAYAAATVGPEDIKRSAVRSTHIKNGTVAPADLNRTLRRLVNRTGGAGPAGPFSEALPAGRTLRGTYAVQGNPTAADQAFEANVPFAFSFTSGPTPHFVALNAPKPAECPGDSGNPAAARGHLCVYEAARDGLIKAVTIFDPAGTAQDATSRFGFGVRAVADAAQPLRSTGTWAVTAP